MRRTNKIARELMREELPIQHKLLNLILAAAFCGGVVSLAASIVLQLEPIALITVASLIVVVGFSLWIANAKKKPQIAAILIAFIANMILLPVMYFTSGGLYSGMPVWVLLGLIFSWLILQGRWCVVMYIINTIAAIGCMLAEMWHPELVMPIESRNAVYFDMIQSMVIVTWIFGGIFKFQTHVYEEQRKQILKANAAKSEFLANMSHEIRTPINAVVGMNEMILRECEDGEIKEYAFNIQSASRTLLSLINDILDLSKIEAGKMEIIDDSYKLSAVLYDVVNMVQIKTEQKKLEFKVEVDENLPNHLYGDEVRIRQVMVNLLNNAVKYTKEGSVFLKVTGEKLPDERINLKISVSDTGIGIRAEDMDKLYGAFERLEQKENRNIEGTGLGLSITARMLELMQGRMEVESVYGEGSTFTVYFPQKINAEGNIGSFEAKYHEFAEAMQTYQESFEAPEAKVLVVDDNEMNLFVVSNLLKKTKMGITCCDRGEKCLELVKKNVFDVILLDHMMPGMDGIETMKKLKTMEDNLCKAAPVIALTANAIVGVHEMYLQEGFDDYLSKPIESEKLESMLKRHIAPEKMRPVSTVKKEEKKSLPVVEQHTEALNVTRTEKPIRGTIDVFLGLQYSAEDDEMYRDFIQMFCDSWKERLEKIQACYDKEDWKNYTVLIHALKSTSLNIGAKKLSERALELEMAGKEKRIPFIRERHDAMLRLYESTVNEGYQILESDICM